MNDFGDFVDTEGLCPEERRRLRRVHELLVEAGPPPDLPPALERAPPSRPRHEDRRVPAHAPRRWAVAAVVAATSRDRVRWRLRARALEDRPVRSARTS